MKLIDILNEIKIIPPGEINVSMLIKFAKQVQEKGEYEDIATTFLDDKNREKQLKLYTKQELEHWIIGFDFPENAKYYSYNGQYGFIGISNFDYTGVDDYNADVIEFIPNKIWGIVGYY